MKDKRYPHQRRPVLPARRQFASQYDPADFYLDRTRCTSAVRNTSSIPQDPANGILKSAPNQHPPCPKTQIFTIDMEMVLFFLVRINYVVKRAYHTSGDNTQYSTARLTTEIRRAGLQHQKPYTTAQISKMLSQLLREYYSPRE